MARIVERVAGSGDGEVWVDYAWDGATKNLIGFELGGPKAANATLILDLPTGRVTVTGAKTRQVSGIKIVEDTGLGARDYGAFRLELRVNHRG